MSEVKIKNISKTFGKFKALDIDNIEISENSYVTILGPSGSGKTTLLRIISGLETQDEGEIIINGKNVETLPPWKRNIGLVFQNYALYPHLNVFQNISMPLIQQKVSPKDIEENVMEVAKIMRINDQLEKIPSQLSGGQQQRVALARALIKKPDVLLLDEPLSNLDAKVRVELRDYLKESQRKFNLTAIHVTHDQTEGLALGDIMVVMSGGKIEQIGTPEDIYENPATEFVADFVGEVNHVSSKFLNKNESPEKVYLLRYEEAFIEDDGKYEGTVMNVQYMGYRKLLTVSSAEQEIRFYVPSNLKIKEGQKIKFSINNNKFNSFS
ncbi:ABC transporter ATP-binding protein [Caldiplasma sukawensis]